MKEPVDIVSSTGVPAFGVDERGSIVIWNRAAQKLLGYTSDQVLGKSCYRILCGRDIFGNRYCDSACNPRRMVRRREPVRSFVLDFLKSDGKRCRSSITVVAFPGRNKSGTTLLHLLQPLEVNRRVSERKVRPRPVSTRPSGPSLVAAPAGDRFQLTTRELQVLRMVAGGRSNREIGDTLFISVSTVRTHIEHILRKLRVHTRTEAVSLAHRHRWLS